MQKTFLSLYLCIALAAALSWVGCSGRSSQAGERDKLTKQFMECLPDSLDDARREEILALFDLFWNRVDRDLVYPEDVEEITTKLRGYVEAGRITPSDLLYYMAQVGYYTYRMDPRYNLPEGVADHPTINPDAALIQVGTDSLGNITGFYLPPKKGTDTTKTKTPR